MNIIADSNSLVKRINEKSAGIVDFIGIYQSYTIPIKLDTLLGHYKAKAVFNEGGEGRLPNQRGKGQVNP